jgi:hypothetical protein
MNRLLTITVLLLSAAGCAAGQHYDYAAADMALPVTGSGEIGVAVIDVRPYVLNGEKKPDFVGLQRGGFGNPFDVTTQSGNPLAMDMQQVLIDALKDGGYHAQPIRITTAEDAVIARVIAAVGSPVNVLLFVREWKTDAMMKLGLTYDIELKVLGEQSDLWSSRSKFSHRR